MPGYFKNIEDVMGICDACLMPSFIEGWSIAMNEAMFYRKPLILTDTGGASEVIGNNEIGILIPNEYGSSDSLDNKTLDELAYTPHQYRIAGLIADAMINFADNRQHWKQAGELGRQKIYSQYSFVDVVSQYEELMMKAIHHNRFTTK
jgi:glycosyltransferase involved in cell wall biosynthesis